MEWFSCCSFLNWKILGPKSERFKAIAEYKGGVAEGLYRAPMPCVLFMLVVPFFAQSSHTLAKQVGPDEKMETIKLVQNVNQERLETVLGDITRIQSELDRIKQLLEESSGVVNRSVILAQNLLNYLQILVNKASACKEMEIFSEQKRQEDAETWPRFHKDTLECKAAIAQDDLLKQRYREDVDALEHRIAEVNAAIPGLGIKRDISARTLEALQAERDLLRSILKTSDEVNGVIDEILGAPGS